MLEGLGGSNPPLSVKQSAMFAFSAENSEIARTFASFLSPKGTGETQIRAAVADLSRFSLSRIKPVPFAPSSACIASCVSGARLLLPEKIKTTERGVSEGHVDLPTRRFLFRYSGRATVVGVKVGALSNPPSSRG